MDTGKTQVVVFSSSAGLREALKAVVGIFAKVVAIEALDALGEERGTVLIVPASDVTPDACRTVVSRGLDVVVLAAVPSERERGTYLRAGAKAYVPMTVGVEHLQEAVVMASPGR